MCFQCPNVFFFLFFLQGCKGAAGSFKVAGPKRTKAPALPSSPAMNEGAMKKTAKIAVNKRANPKSLKASTVPASPASSTLSVIRKKVIIPTESPKKVSVPRKSRRTTAKKWYHDVKSDHLCQTFFLTKIRNNFPYNNIRLPHIFLFNSRKSRDLIRIQ